MPDKIAKFLKAIDSKLKQRLAKKIEEIITQCGDVPGRKKLKGAYENTYRVRVGDVRIMYTINKESTEIIDIDWRGNIY